MRRLVGLGSRCARGARIGQRVTPTVRCPCARDDRRRLGGRSRPIGRRSSTVRAAARRPTSRRPARRQTWSVWRHRRPMPRRRRGEATLDARDQDAPDFDAIRARPCHRGVPGRRRWPGAIFEFGAPAASSRSATCDGSRMDHPSFQATTRRRSIRSSGAADDAVERGNSDGVSGSSRGRMLEASIRTPARSLACRRSGRVVGRPVRSIPAASASLGLPMASAGPLVSGHGPRRRDAPAARAAVTTRHRARCGGVHQTEPVAAELGAAPGRTSLDRARRGREDHRLRALVEARKFTGECPMASTARSSSTSSGRRRRQERIATCETEVDPTTRSCVTAVHASSGVRLATTRRSDDGGAASSAWSGPRCQRQVTSAAPAGPPVAGGPESCRGGCRRSRQRVMAMPVTDGSGALSGPAACRRRSVRRSRVSPIADAGEQSPGRERTRRSRWRSAPLRGSDQRARCSG